AEVERAFCDALALAWTAFSQGLNQESSAMVMAALALLPNSEAMAPGCTVRTWMPKGASSRRRASDRACSAALDAQYTPEKGVVVTPETLPILTISPRASRSRSAWARTISSGAKTL